MGWPWRRSRRQIASRLGPPACAPQQPPAARTGSGSPPRFVQPTRTGLARPGPARRSVGLGLGGGRTRAAGDCVAAGARASPGLSRPRSESPFPSLPFPGSGPGGARGAKSRRGSRPRWPPAAWAGGPGRAGSDEPGRRPGSVRTPARRGWRSLSGGDRGRGRDRYVGTQMHGQAEGTRRGVGWGRGWQGAENYLALSNLIGPASPRAPRGADLSRRATAPFAGPGWARGPAGPSG